MLQLNKFNNRVLVIDNYDSFTYNLVHLVRSLGVPEVVVVRNDAFEFDLLSDFHKIILSPGPGLPSEAGKMPQVVRDFASQKSILGVCLGHQCIAEVFGGTLHNLKQVVHGKATPCRLTAANDVIFKELPNEFEVGRYHSWVVDQSALPDCLEVTAQDDEGFIMALRHKNYDVTGVQFHPESVLTPLGPQMLLNWLSKS
jgi:anthranilate synthase component 2